MLEEATQDDLDRAQRTARMVELKISQREWAAAHAAVDAARNEYLEAEDPAYDPLELPLAETGLSVRTVNALERMGVMTLGQLAATDTADILCQPNVGASTLKEINMTLDAYGLYVPPDDLPPRATLKHGRIITPRMCRRCGAANHPDLGACGNCKAILPR